MRNLLLSVALVLMSAIAAFGQQEILQSSTSYPLIFGPVVESSDHITGKTGIASFDLIKISKGGGSGVTPSGAVTEIDATNLPGWYKIAGNATDTGTYGPIVVHVEESGADPLEMVVGIVVSFDPRSVPTLAQLQTGIWQTLLASSDCTTSGSICKLIKDYLDVAVSSVSGGGSGDPVKTIAKGEAFTNFPIWMLGSSGNAVTGLTTTQITCQTSKDGGAWASLADTAEVEVGLGKYLVDLSTSETNGNSVSIDCSATGAQHYRTNITPQR